MRLQRGALEALAALRQTPRRRWDGYGRWDFAAMLPRYASLPMCGPIAAASAQLARACALDSRASLTGLEHRQVQLTRCPPIRYLMYTTSARAARRLEARGKRARRRYSEAESLPQCLPKPQTITCKMQ